ncbi:MAG: 2-amino-4-hydroxy-6-hydroxymethyldihydropteridine diphosphokinase [Candidatus Eisenbacteria bacterium]
MSRVWIALGSNLGDREDNVSRAVSRLAELDLPPGRLSHVYETEPEHGADEPPYLNAVLQTESERDPVELLRILQQIETELGRPPVGTARSGSRTLDLDLLAVGEWITEGDGPENGDTAADAVGPDDEVGANVGTAGPKATGRAADTDLVLPHPRLHLRSFVLVPLCEIDPHWRHPVLGQTAAALLAELEVEAGSVRLHGSLGLEPAGPCPYPWRQLPARGGI